VKTRVKTHVIVGCGVIGLATALELLGRGERVTLVDAADQEGAGTSFANGGLLTPSMSDPWNSPGVHRHLFESLTSSSAALKLRLRALPSLAIWGPKFLLHSRPAPHRRATIANFALSTYSLGVLEEWRQAHALAFDDRRQGALKIFRSAAALDASLAVSRLLEREGLIATVVDRDAMVRIEPCLAPIRDQLAGAIFYPSDASGDAHLFCREAARTVRALGGEIRLGRRARAIETGNGRVTGVAFDDGVLATDALIVATGVASPALVAALGVRLAVKPVKGYSMTYAADAGVAMPGLPIIDDGYHAAITPLGARLRVAGTAEFAGNDLRLDARRVGNLATLFKAIYPAVATDRTLATGTPWAGLRPVSADGLPFIGEAPTAGLWINSGHGHLGWTQAAGSARLLADLMAGERPAIDPAPFAVSR
jgi:D-amino-acid dehydrogenase